jgi:hypothetical protein
MPGAGWRSASPAAATAAFELPIYKAPLEYPNLFNTVRSRAWRPSAASASASLYRWYHLRDERL